MEFDLLVKIVDDVVKRLSPEFCERHFGKISLCLIGLMAVPTVAECVETCVDKIVRRDCFIVAVENGLITGASPNALVPPTINSQATT